MITRYCSVDDVYRKAGIESDTVMEADVLEHILDAEAEVDELYGKTFVNATSVTQWFNTTEDNFHKIPEPEVGLLYLEKLPVQAITSVEEYDTNNTLVKTWTSTEYWVDLETGELRLIEDVFDKQYHRVKVVYTYGYTTVPRVVKRLTTLIAGISVATEIIGKYKAGITGYSLPTGVSVSKPPMYQIIKMNAESMQEELDRIKETLGLLKSNSVVI